MGQAEVVMRNRKLQVLDGIWEVGWQRVSDFRVVPDTEEEEQYRRGN